MTAINYSIIKSKRKTVAIQVKLNGEVVIRAPYKYSNSIIAQFVNKHQDWINKKLTSVEQVKNVQLEPIKNREFYYLGIQYPLEIINYENVKFAFKNDKFITSENYTDKKLQIALINWYKDEVLKLIEEPLAYYAALFKLKYKKVSITSANFRWGSCSRNGDLNFSYRLAMLPQYVINYIVKPLHNYSIKMFSGVYGSNL